MVHYELDSRIIFSLALANASREYMVKTFRGEASSNLARA
jgi:hypothetical protein